MKRRHFLNSALALGLAATGCTNRPARVVLYCAQDREFAEPLLAEFSALTGIEVAAKYDSEADKSVGLVEELLREKQRPRCDVFWNNEVLGTIRLQRHGVLAEYGSVSAGPYPAWTKAPKYQMFAARARVFLVNRKLLGAGPPPSRLFDLVDARWQGRFALARPFFGTTATHAACLFATLGDEAAQRFFRDLKNNGARVMPGNKQAAQAVSRGEVLIGLTDTDDAIIEVDAGHPVEIIYPDRAPDHAQPDLGTLFIPNTIGLIRNGPDGPSGRKLIDFLLSAEVEAKLAANASRQIPLNPQVRADLPAAILRPEAVHAQVVDFERAADCWEHAQTTLRNLFTH